MKNDIDSIIIFFIGVVLVFMDAVVTLSSISYKGIFINKRDTLLQKTNKELRLMLAGHKRINSLKKIELVDLLLTTG